MKSFSNLPTVWDEVQIMRQFVAIQNQPTALAHYIQHLKNRFILTTEDRTAQVRTRFLRTYLEQVDLAKQYQMLVNELAAMEDEQENRLLRLELEKKELVSKRHHAETLKDLRLSKERLVLEVEIAELKTKKRSITSPPIEEAGLSPDKQRQIKRIDIEGKLRELDRLEEDALKNARSEEDQMRIRNMHADKREELRGNLSKVLV